MSEFGNGQCDGIGWSGPGRERGGEIGLATGSRCGKSPDREWCGRRLCRAHWEQVTDDPLYAAYLALRWAARALQDGAADAFQHAYDSLEDDPEFQLLMTEGTAATDAVAYLNYELRRIESERSGELEKTSGSLDGSGRPAGDGDRKP